MIFTDIPLRHSRSGISYCVESGSEVYTARIQTRGEVDRVWHGLSQAPVFSPASLAYSYCLALRRSRLPTLLLFPAVLISLP